MSQQSQFYNDSIFWVEVDKIKPNPYQPRKEFDQIQLKALADSIRQYGVLQALVVTRKELLKQDGGLAVEYELIAGERRLRASKLAGVTQVPVLIKTGEQSDLMKLELAIIENVQREDLNPVDRARAFQKLVEEFSFKHSQIGEKIGKSREYVSNSLRLLSLPSDILDALSQGRISEGHARPLMMLGERPMEQSTLFKEILFRKMTVREAEMIARKIATDKVRKKDYGFDPEIKEIEEKLTESLGTRVHIERRDVGGKVQIDFFSNDDLRMILELVNKNRAAFSPELLSRFLNAQANQKESQKAHQQTQLQNGNTITAPSEQTVQQDKAKLLIQELNQEEGIIHEPVISLSDVSHGMSAPHAEVKHLTSHEVVPIHLHPIDVESMPSQVEEIKQQAEAITHSTGVNVTMPVEHSPKEEIHGTTPLTSEMPIDDRSPQEIKKEDDEEIYSVSNFTI